MGQELILLHLYPTFAKLLYEAVEGQKDLLNSIRSLLNMLKSIQMFRVNIRIAVVGKSGDYQNMRFFWESVCMIEEYLSLKDKSDNLFLSFSLLFRFLKLHVSGI